MTYRTTDAARVLGLSVKTIQKLAKEGILRCYWSTGQPGSGVRIFEEQALAEFRQRSAGGQGQEQRTERRVLR